MTVTIRKWTTLDTIAIKRFGGVDASPDGSRAGGAAPFSLAADSIPA